MFSLCSRCPSEGPPWVSGRVSRRSPHTIPACKQWFSKQKNHPDSPEGGAVGPPAGPLREKPGWFSRCPDREPEGAASLPSPAVATLSEKGSPTALTVYIASGLELLQYPGTRALQHKAIPGTTGLRLRTS